MADSGQVQARAAVCGVLCIAVLGNKLVRLAVEKT